MQSFNQIYEALSLAGGKLDLVERNPAALREVRPILYNGLEAFQELLTIDPSATIQADPAIKIRRVLELTESDSLYHAIEAALRIKEGDRRGAYGSCVTAVKLEPNNPRRLAQLASILEQLGEHPEQPEDLVADHERAKVLAHALTCSANDAALGNKLVACYRKLEMHQAAYETSRVVSMASPDVAASAMFYAQSAATIGLKDEALRAYERCHRLDPIDGVAYRARVEDYPTSFSEKDLDHLSALRLRATEPAKIEFDFAIGHILERHRRYDEAFKHFARAKQLAEKVYFGGKPFDIESSIAIYHRMRAVFDKIEGGLAPIVPAIPSNPVPIFIVGMPRSGTSLVERILASYQSADGVSRILPAHEPLTVGLFYKVFRSPVKRTERELDRLPFEVVKRYFEGMSRQFDLEMKPAVRFLIDKMPFNFHSIELIAQLFPASPIIHCKRNALDTCLSNFQRNHMDQRDMQVFNNLHLVGRYHKEVYQPIMAMYHRCLPGKILDVSYESLVDNPRDVIGSMLSFCGLPWSERCMDFHTTGVPAPTEMKVNEPIFKSSIGRWRNYERHLKPLTDILGDGVY